MLSDEVIEKVVERLVNRIEQANLYVLKEIGRSINKIGTFNPSKASQLVQMLEYGGDYDKIVKELAKITNLNVKDIQDIFEEVAKSDYNFAKRFYDYRGKKFIPYKDNKALQDQVNALAKITAQDYINLTKTSALGFGIEQNGKMTFKGIQQTYQDLLDEAVLSISQGKETFNSAMYRQLKNIASSGLKVVYPTTYIGADGKEHNYTRRLDSAVRMNIKSAVRNLHNEMQKQIGEQIDADGVEISVHENPAEDHQDAQGKQFSNEEYEKLQTTGIAKTYDKIEIDMHNGRHFRPISEWNCYHYIFAIILGVDEPQYTNEQLKEIIDRNNKGFEFEGQHYTMYQGTQLQRQIETEIRRQKDIQIMGKEAGNEQLIQDSQANITALNRKYKELNDASGLRPKMDRLKVDGYERVKIKKDSVKIEPKPLQQLLPKDDDYTFFISKDKQIETNKLAVKEAKENYKKSNDRAKEFYKKAKEKGNNPETSYDYYSSHYRDYKKDVQKYKEQLEELQNKTFEDKTIKLTDYDSCKELLDTANIKMYDDMKKMDNKVMIENTAQLYRLNEKYPIVSNQISKKQLGVYNDLKGERKYAQTNGMVLQYNNHYFGDYERLKQDHISDGKINWHYVVQDKDATIYSTTHEFGHILQERYCDAYNDTRDLLRRKNWQEFDSMVMEGIYDEAKRATGLSISELKKQYLTGYGTSKRNFEAFAEIFAGMELGIDNPLTKAMKEYLEVMDKWM